jgi:hypothetical protein
MDRDGCSCRNALAIYLRSEPEEVNVASDVVAMGRSGVRDRIRRGGRQNAYATLFGERRARLCQLSETPTRQSREGLVLTQIWIDGQLES